MAASAKDKTHKYLGYKKWDMRDFPSTYSGPLAGGYSVPVHFVLELDSSSFARPFTFSITTLRWYTYPKSLRLSLPTTESTYASRVIKTS